MRLRRLVLLAAVAVTSLTAAACGTAEDRTEKADSPTAIPLIVTVRMAVIVNGIGNLYGKTPCPVGKLRVKQGDDQYPNAQGCDFPDPARNFAIHQVAGVVITQAAPPAPDRWIVQLELTEADIAADTPKIVSADQFDSGVAVPFDIAVGDEVAQSVTFRSPAFVDLHRITVSQGSSVTRHDAEVLVQQLIGPAVCQSGQRSECRPASGTYPGA